jgi:hypothetical protein
MLAGPGAVTGAKVRYYIGQVTQPSHGHHHGTIELATEVLTDGQRRPLDNRIYARFYEHRHLRRNEAVEVQANQLESRGGDLIAKNIRTATIEAGVSP